MPKKTETITPTVCFTDLERKQALLDMQAKGLIANPASFLRECIDILAEFHGIEIANKTKIRREMISPELREKILQLYKDGHKGKAIAAMTGVSAETVAQIKSRAKKAKTK